jgi:cerevisin
MSTLFCLSLLVASAVATPLSTPFHDVPRQRSSLALAPLHPVQPQFQHPSLNDSYIIMLKHDIDPSLMDNHFNFLQSVHEEDSLAGDVNSGVRQIYDGHVKGYAGRFTEQTINRIREMPEVNFIEKDQIVNALEVQHSATWGLARISHRPRLTFGTFTRYEYDTLGGQGVDVYIIDTGINVEHFEFQGRASWGKTVPQDVDEDANGHGTHCAGTIGSRKYGVAKAANLIAVKVLGSNGSGSMSDVVGGVVWAAQQAKAKLDAARAEYLATGKTKHKGSVANMSLGGGKSQALDDAVNRAVDSGMHFAVAAGNDNRDACSYSPAAAEKAVTVGASTLGDERAYFSNFGPCVDVFAPGLNILSTYIGHANATTTMSGTSMASPHTAGMLAYLLSLYPSATFNPEMDGGLIPPALDSVPQRAFSSLYTFAHSALPSWVSSVLPPPSLLDAVAPLPNPLPTLTPAQLKKALLDLATKNVLATLPDDTPNLLIFNNATTA